MPSNLIAGSRPVRVDIAIIADIRVGDVAAPCHAAVAAALLEAGYSVALVPVIADTIAADPYRIDPDAQSLLDTGAVRRVASGATVECGLALAFDARIFATTLARAPEIKARHRIVTIERPAGLVELDRPALDRLRARAETALGGPVTWCPTSVIARDAMAYSVPDWPVADEDWAPVVPDLSHVRPDAAERARPTIGRARIARARPTSDWPARFLKTPFLALRERGDSLADTPRWPQAAPIEVWPETALTLPEFFAKVDLLANPDLAQDDPLPVEALMALSAGVIPCLPESYRELFGGAAIYGSDTELAKAIIDLKMNPDLMASIRQSGATLLREVFAPELFVARVRTLLGPPEVERFAPAVHAEPNTRVLFYSSNGIGMGHLTRQLAVARRLPERLTPVFISHSRAVDTVRQFGFVAEHLPYHATYGEARAHWNVGLSQTLTAAFAFYQPEVLVFDGNVPFKGLLAALSSRPGMASVWIRRAMWGQGRDVEALDRATAFDLVVEPLDPAWSRDEGPTADRLSDVRVVPPVRILDTAEMPNRANACAALGLDPDGTNILIATGSGNNFDMAGVTDRVINRLAGCAGVGLAVAEWQIAQDRLDLPEGLVRLTGYPFAQYLPAFDAAVAAPGYNTFCEHLAAALPTLWVPNEHEQMDQQIERARYAADCKAGLIVRSTAPFDVEHALTALLDPDARTAMAAASARLAEDCMATNGASAIAELVVSLAGSSIARLLDLV
ncbi:MAG: glycosyltransferase [Ruegeria sp.]|uniref:glycosyltransferase n=1 Tax=Ruegeria sp. TaxID=1879320 RepID=UPI00349E4DCF